MTQLALIAGGGIGGLSSALACARAGWRVVLFERAAEFAEVGAGIQLAPNATQVLHHWGLGQELARVVTIPEQLVLRSALSGRRLACLPLGAAMAQRYGAPYVTLHRADLQALLLGALQAHSQVQIELNSPVQNFTQTEHEVLLRTSSGASVSGDMLIGADGVHSQVRQCLLADGPAHLSGHIAYRALVELSSLAPTLNYADLTLWFGPGWHVVHYPVRGGQWLNVVLATSGGGEPQEAATVPTTVQGACTPLQDLLQAIAHWNQWPLRVRAPMHAAHEHARGRVALLGDAAHPMLPHAAQGAGMALEDAFELGRLVGLHPFEPSVMLRHYAQRRWQRNARVQTQSLRNGKIAHARGLLRWGRDASLGLLGKQLLEAPWLYRGVVN